MNKISKFQVKTASELLISPWPQAPMTWPGPGRYCLWGLQPGNSKCYWPGEGHVSSGEPHTGIRAAPTGADVMLGESSQTQRLPPAGFCVSKCTKPGKKVVALGESREKGAGRGFCGLLTCSRLIRVLVARVGSSHKNSSSHTFMACNFLYVRSAPKEVKTK